jgi:hypothetical protein
VDAATRFGPGYRPGGPTVESIESRAYLQGPGRLGVGIDLGFETVNQFASERGSLRVRESKGFRQDLFRVHAEKLARDLSAGCRSEGFRQ